MTRKAFVARDPRIEALLDRIAEALGAEGLQVVRGPMPAAGEKLLYPGAVHDELFAEADVALFSGASHCTKEVLAHARNLRGVVYPAVGVETLDLGAANALGIIVGHGAVPENTQGMAEATVMLMLALSYQLRRSEQALRDDAPRPAPEDTWVRALHGRTIGLVGFGRIARAVAVLLRPFGAPLLAFHPAQQAGAIEDGVEFASLDRLLEASDIVSLHVTIDAASRGMIGARELARMKRSAYLVNTSRGDAVDESALADALARGVIAGAALDTFRVEPLPQASPLRRLDNVILTPHMVGQTRESLTALVPAAVDNVRRILAGELPRYCKNPEIRPQWLARLRMLDAAGAATPRVAG
jgi:phosphoglycerate dehydrogenase-like enzyme